MSVTAEDRLGTSRLECAYEPCTLCHTTYIRARDVICSHCLSSMTGKMPQNAALDNESVDMPNSIIAKEDDRLT